VAQTLRLLKLPPVLILAGLPALLSGCLTASSVVAASPDEICWANKDLQVPANGHFRTLPPVGSLPKDTEEVRAALEQLFRLAIAGDFSFYLRSPSITPTSDPLVFHFSGIFYMHVYGAPNTITAVTGTFRWDKQNATIDCRDNSLPSK